MNRPPIRYQWSIRKPVNPQASADGGQVATPLNGAAKQPDDSPSPGAVRSLPPPQAHARAPVNGHSVGNGAAVPSTVNGGGGTGAPNGGGGGGGRGGGGSPPLHRRSSEREFRDVLGKGLANTRRNLVIVGIFSIMVNLLVLAIPVYLFNMLDRVLTSRSTDTLVMLTMIVVVAIGAHVLMDMIRRIIQMRVAVETEARLGGPVLSAAAKAAQSGSSCEFQTLADLQHLRSFITGPVLLTMFDAPVTPVYFAVVFLIHPHLGLIVLGSGAVLLGVAILNQRVTAVPFTRANAFGTRANLQAEAMARNAQVINAMGMTPERVQVWGRETVESVKAQVAGQDLNILMTGISNSFASAPRLRSSVGEPGLRWKAS
jgi:ATP-binding cassette subfamily C protein